MTDGAFARTPLNLYLLWILHFARDVKLPTSLVCHSFEVFPSLQHFSRVCRNGDEHDATHSNASLGGEIVVSVHYCYTACMNRSRNQKKGAPDFRWHRIADKNLLNRTCKTFVETALPNTLPSLYLSSPIVKTPDATCVRSRKRQVSTTLAIVLCVLSSIVNKIAAAQDT